MGRSRKNAGRVSAKRWREEVRGGSNYLRLPEGVKLFSGKLGTYRLDFMSFVAGKGNPRAEEGEAYFERTFFVHQGVGPNQDWHLCMAKTMKKPCPICEHRAKMSADPEADESVIKALAPKERQLWIVKDLLNDPESVLVWEVSYHLFGRMLKDKINNADEEDGYDFFADPVDGLTMRLALQQSDRGKWIETADIEFRPRKQKYESSIIEEMPCLDDLLVATPYDKLKAIFLQTDEETEEDGVDLPDDRREGKQSSRSKAAEKSQPKEFSAGDKVWYEGKPCEVLRVSGDGSSLMLEDGDGEILRAIDACEVEAKPLKEREKEEGSRETKSRTEEAKKTKEDKWDDDWDEDEESKPRKTEGASASKQSAKESDEPELKSKKKAKGEDDDWDDDDWDD